MRVIEQIDTSLLIQVLVETVGVVSVVAGLTYSMFSGMSVAQILIPLGSLLIAAGAAWNAKIYDGDSLFAYVTSDGSPTTNTPVEESVASTLDETSKSNTKASSEKK